MANKKRKPIGNFTKVFLLASIITVIVTPLYIKRQTVIQSDARASKYKITMLADTPKYQDHISFVVTGGIVETGQLWLLNECTQNNVVVYQQYEKIQIDGNSGPFSLGPTPSWSSGGANCTATVELYNKGRFRPQGSISYTVAP